MLDIRMIGAFDIQCDGKPVTLSSRAAQSLFAYLVLTAGTLHRREKLAGMFWPEVAEEKARASLRHELWLIHKTLPSLKTDYLIADELHIGFNASAKYRSDVGTLESVSGSASIDELMAALSPYHGELLPGLYDDWISSEREHLQSIYEQKMARLLELLAEEKRWNDVLDWAGRWISVGQGPEAAYRYLMIAYDALGDRAKVASTYQRCVQALRELDLEPSEQTRTLAFKRSSKLNIPIPRTSLIGREKELREIADLLSKSRLVTLTGSGGVGKTRLAIHVAAEVLDRFPGGVWFLDLAPLRDPELVPDALAEVLNLHLRGGSGSSITDLIIGYLSSRRALIIFDNCEHLIDACARLIDSLLGSCIDLQIIATSREALRISGETPYRVPSLELPRADVLPAIDALAKTESVRLFMERAAVVSPGFDLSSHNGLVISQICQRLDGIPLAIELAAARANVLAIEQILKRLDDRFNLLTSGLRNMVPRQQTLRATIEWSYDLLSEKERVLFRRLAVFTGGWTLEAAEKVCSGSGIETSEVLDLLSHLVNKSLLFVETTAGKARYHKLETLRHGMLTNTPEDTSKARYHRLETLRQFAREKLSESPEVAQLHRNHAAYYSHLDSVPEEELDNVRSVFNWCLETGEAEPALRLAGNFFFWEKRIPEGLQWITRVLALPGAQGKTPERGHALYSAAVLSHFQRSYAAARALVNELFIVSHELNDRDLIWNQKLIHGAVTSGEGDYERAYTIFLENRIAADSFAYAFGYALCTLNMASCALLLHNLDAASQYAQEARQIFDTINTRNYVVDSDMILGYIALEEGNLAMAKTYFRQGIQSAVSNSVQQRLGMIYAGLGGVTLRQGNSREAARRFGIAEMIITTTGYYARFVLERISQGYLAQVRSLLAPDVFQAAWEEGYTMTMEQAIEYALKESQ